MGVQYLLYRIWNLSQFVCLGTFLFYTFALLANDVLLGVSGEIAALLLDVLIDMTLFYCDK